MSRKGFYEAMRRRAEEAIGALSDSHSDSHTAGDGLLATHNDSHSDNQPGIISTLQTMSPNSRALLAYIANAGDAVINISTDPIPGCDGTVMKYATRRLNLKKLIDVGAIASRSRYHMGCRQGVTLEVSAEWSEALFALYPAMHQTARQLASTPTYSSSSILTEEKETTASQYTTRVMSHPEYEFWRLNGLTQKQISAWMNEFSLDDTSMDTYLRWAAADIPSRDVRSPVNWMYQMLKRTGGYPKPASYMSYEERRAADVAKSAAAREEAVKAYEASLSSDAEKDIPALFEEFIKAGDSDPAYTRLCGEIPAFLRARTDSPAYKNMLYKLFRRMLGMAQDT